MKTVTTIKELKQIIKNHKKENRTIGFVPTMGYLHEGHLSLMKKHGKTMICLSSAFLSIHCSLEKMRILIRIPGIWNGILI